jgi:VWFA-related protein
MQVSVRRTIVALAMSLTALPSIAQTLAPATARPASPATRTITVDVVVDAKGSKTHSPVAGLQQQDFAVFDNKAPRTVESFRAITTGQQPIHVVVLVDAVNLGISRLAYERNQISTFLRAHDGHLAHPTAVAILTDKGVQIQNGFSTDGNEISQDLDKQDIGLRTIGRDAGFYGAEDRFEISMTALRRLIEREATQPGRTVVLWISPGWPLLSGPGVDLSNKQRNTLFGDIISLSTQLREARVTLYAVNPLGASEGVGQAFLYEAYLKGISKSSDVDLGDLGLQVLAMQSGGLAINSNDTVSLLQRCFADIDNYYEISFEAPPSEPAMHTITWR